MPNKDRITAIQSLLNEMGGRDLKAFAKRIGARSSGNKASIVNSIWEKAKGYALHIKREENRLVITAKLTFDE